MDAAAAGYDIDQLVQLFEEVRARGFYSVFMNTTAVMRLVKHGRVPKEVSNLNEPRCSMPCLPASTCCCVGVCVMPTQRGS
jgi:hypothetical protein